MIALLAALLLAAPQRSSAPPPPAPLRATMADFKWMVGCWASTLPDVDIRENWYEAGSDALVGLNRAVRGNLLRNQELMVLKRTLAGVTLEMRSVDQPGASYLLTSVKEGEAVFANTKTREFPQKLTYRLREDDRLVARIDGARYGNVQVVEYPYRRVSCE